MMIGFYSAKQGLTTQQESLNVIANNMANVNTAGFKPMRASFTDLLYQNLNRTTADNTALVGRGVKFNKTDLFFDQGGMNATNYALDFALTEQDTFFAVMDGAGNTYYTRAGNFIMSNDDGTFYLAAGNGDRVLDMDGSEIELTFDDEGKLEFDPSVVGVFRFPNPYGLNAIGDNRYVETDTSGEPYEVETPGILNGYLEGSAVEVANEMVKMIESQRGFSFNSRMLQVADEIEQIVNSLR